MIWTPPAPAIIIPKAPEIIRPGDPRFIVATLPGLAGLSGKGAAAAGGGGGTTASNFLARAATARGSALDATHISAFTAYLDGLDSDSLTAAFDVLVCTAGQDSASALINMISSSYNGTAHGSPSFTADRGYTGVLSSTTVYIDTGYNPITATSPLYTQNSAHFSAFSVTDVGVQGVPMMGSISNGVTENTIYPRFSDGNAYGRINDNGSLSGGAVANPVGHYILNRSSSTDVQFEKDGTSIKTSTSDNSTAIPNQNFYVLLANQNVGGGSPHQCALYSLGRALTSTEKTNFRTRTRTLLTALGVP